ncbi:hypothetical protein [Nocardioides sp. KR10-350]|uniref:hypothetical protein n=1 Tax=Nocardioides cheoyonin TaxID=3156615 RepID=UPI0032B34F7C
MDDLHLEADLFFGPCNDPDCPAVQLIESGRLRVDSGWPNRNHLRLITGADASEDAE